MIPITKKQIKYNFSKRESEIKYIVIHDTGNTSPGANSDSHFNYFNSSDKQSSANYFVDDSKIIETVEPKQFRSWHCGDGKGKFGITNDNSIGVEICINKDGDYDKTIKNTQDLVKHLMNEFNIPIERVVRHYDASRKQCPYTLINSVHNYSWNDFKRGLSKQIVYRVCVGSYVDINNARKKAKEINGFIIKSEI